MLEILKKVFEERFVVVPIVEGVSFFAKAKDKKRPEYFVVSTFKDFHDLKNDFAENFKDLYGKALSFVEGERIDKDLSLLVCVRVGDLKVGKKDGGEIFDVEEDPYLMKKYVLPYTDKQCHDFFAGKECHESTTSFLKRIVANSEEFDGYKEGPYNDTKYNLAIRMLIKLPFLDIEQSKEEVIKSPRVLLEAEMSNDERLFLQKLLDERINFLPGDDEKKGDVIKKLCLI